MKTAKSSGAARMKSLRRLPRVRVAGGLTLRFLPVPRQPYRVSLLHEALPPFSSTPALYHRFTSEFVFVLKGSATAYLDGRRMRLRAGDMFEIPPGVRHQFVTRRGGVSALSLFSPPLDPRKPDACPGTDAVTGARAAKDALKLERA